MTEHSCCFTGHRPQKLTRSEQEITIELEKAINQAIADGFTTFITGMAAGTDIIAGEIITSLHTPSLRLIAAVPFPSFPNRLGAGWKLRYEELLEKTDEVIYICPHYSRSAFQRRNVWMVDHSSRVIAVYSGKAGGTRNTINYAKRKKVLVTIIAGEI